MCTDNEMYQSAGRKSSTGTLLLRLHFVVHTKEYPTIHTIEVHFTWTTVYLLTADRCDAFRRFYFFVMYLFLYNELLRYRNWLASRGQSHGGIMSYIYELLRAQFLGSNLITFLALRIVTFFTAIYNRQNRCLWTPNFEP